MSMQADGGAGALADNVAHFGRALRAAGLKVGPATIIDAITALKLGGIGTREDVYWTLASIFVKRHEDAELFDQAFALFWRKRALMERMLQALMPVTAAPQDNSKRDPVSRRISDAMFDEASPPAERPRPQIDIDSTLTVSERELLRSKDFQQMTADEIAAARKLIARLTLPFDTVTTRRMEPAARGPLIDTRRTLRASLRAGGGMISLKRVRPQRRHPPIVALCDISGSMSEYTQVFLHFLHALTERRRRVASFVFSTRLTNVTRALRQRDPDEALALCSDQVADWSGGTRIADCLGDFNRTWSRRVLGQGAVVLLITDGLERDDPGGELARVMERLHKSCRRLVWLNPLLRYDGFEARAAGIRAMMPHVDEFRPVHNIAAMEGLCAALQQRVDHAASPRKWLSRIADRAA